MLLRPFAPLDHDPPDVRDRGGADCVLYFMGRRLGHHVPKLPLLRRFLDEKHLARAERAFHSHGGKTLFIVRFLPGLRAACYFTAGSFKLPFWKMLVFDGGAALISVPTLVLVGFFFSSHFDKLHRLTKEVQILIALAVIAVVAGFLVIKIFRRRAVASAG